MTATLNQPLTSSPDSPAILVAADYAQGSRARRGERLDHVGKGAVELFDQGLRQGSAGGMAGLAGQVDGTPVGRHDRVAEPGRLQQRLRVDQPVRGLAVFGHRPVHSGGRLSVNALWNSAWSSLRISRAWAAASSSMALPRSTSCSRVSRSLVAA